MGKWHFLTGWVAVFVGVLVASGAAAALIGPGRASTPAERALREAMEHCGKARVVWQASSTNELGIIWFSAKCEVQK